MPEGLQRSTGDLPSKMSELSTLMVNFVMELKLIESKGLNSQEMIVADKSGAVCLSVWENKVNTMKQGKTYMYHDEVREYVNMHVCEEEICINIHQREHH